MLLKTSEKDDEVDASLIEEEVNKAIGKPSLSLSIPHVPPSQNDRESKQRFATWRENKTWEKYIAEALIEAKADGQFVEFPPPKKGELRVVHYRLYLTGNQKRDPNNAHNPINKLITDNLQRKVIRKVKGKKQSVPSVCPILWDDTEEHCLEVIDQHTGSVAPILFIDVYTLEEWNKYARICRPEQVIEEASKTKAAARTASTKNKQKASAGTGKRLPKCRRDPSLFAHAEGPQILDLVELQTGEQFVVFARKNNDAADDELALLSRFDQRPKDSKGPESALRTTVDKVAKVELWTSLREAEQEALRARWQEWVEGSQPLFRSDEDERKERKRLFNLEERVSEAKAAHEDAKAVATAARKEVESSQEALNSHIRDMKAPQEWPYPVD